MTNLLANRDLRAYYLDHVEYLLDTAFTPEAFAALIGDDGDDGLWRRVSQAAYLESGTPNGAPFTGRQWTQRRGLAQWVPTAGVAARERARVRDRALRAHAPRPRPRPARPAAPGPARRRRGADFPVRARATACPGLIMGGRPPGVRLRLEREAKPVELLAGAPGRRLEASGVLAKDDGFCVIFDNRPDIVRLGPDLVTGAPENRVGTPEAPRGHGLRGHRLRPRLRSILRTDRGLAGPVGATRSRWFSSTVVCGTAQRLAGVPAGRCEQGYGGIDLPAQQRPDVSAGPVPRQPVPGRVVTTAGRRSDPGVQRGGSARRLGLQGPAPSGCRTRWSSRTTAASPRR